MIRPIDLPAGGGLDFGNGDVRHFAQGDAMNVPGLSNPTRQLAERDNQLATKLNETIQEVNNREQFMPVPLPRTVVPPGEEITVTNFRVPLAFEARVLNAAIQSAFGAPDSELNIYYNPSFGGSTGTAVVTATPGAEFDGGVSFFQEGEFVVTLKNKGLATLDLAASVLLAMRPVGTQGTILAGSVITGPSGLPGQTGPPGPAGPPGTGGAGSPGINWTGTWTSLTNYNANDGVDYTNPSSITSSYIARNANVNVIPDGNPATWDILASGGSGGPQGPPGANGLPGATMFGSVATVQGTYTQQGGYVPNVYTNNSAVYNGTFGSPYFSLREVFYGSVGGNSGNAKGLVSLHGQIFTDFQGEVKITLPKQAYGAMADYTNSDVMLTAVAHGTIPVDVGVSGTEVSGVVVRTDGIDAYRVRVICPTPVAVAITINGNQLAIN